MCGIMAFLNSPLGPQDMRQIVLDGLQRISHRGEAAYQGEIWSAPGITIGANRLPFTSGDEPQPVANDNGRYRLLLNGEVYSLHRSRNHRDEPISDTKALANAIAEKGVVEAFRSNHGMYAAIVIDTLEDTVYFARDPFGIKPLYVAVTDRGVLAASEIKALAPIEFVKRIDHVPVGGVWKLANGILERLTDTAVSPDLEASTLDGSAFALRVREALEISVAQQTLDGCQYGIYLSGGIDSAAIYAIAKLKGIPIVPFVLGNANAKDVAAARKVASYYNDELQFVHCPSEGELFELVQETIRITESFEPNVVRQSTVATVLATGAKSFGCRVVLCGEGADELFGGYPEFWSPNANFQEVRRSFLSDLHRTQLQRVDRVNMAKTIEVRVPFLVPQVASLALAKSDALDFATSISGTMAKLPLRMAMIGDLPLEIIEREKVVFSEGAGVRGNNPKTGMFSDIVSKIREFDDRMSEAAKCWNVRNVEEVHYLSIFLSFQYGKYRSGADRVFANSRHTVW
jgi:asparagine synthase (glutamine-hydrolysing)